MKGSTILFAGLALFGAAWLFGRTRLAAAVRFSIEALAIKSGKIQLTIGILNPTNQTAKLSSIVADLLIKGSQIATIEYYQEVKIIPNGKTKITMLVTPKGLGIITTILELTKKGGLKNLTASLLGTANIDNTALPLNVNFKP